jgi:hypothetical protein
MYNFVAQYPTIAPILSKKSGNANGAWAEEQFQEFMT